MYLTLFFGKVVECYYVVFKTITIQMNKPNNITTHLKRA
jgi:hypothetical protein